MALRQNASNVANLGSIVFGDHRGIPWTTISGTAADLVALNGVVGLSLAPTLCGVCRKAGTSSERPICT